MNLKYGSNLDRSCFQGHKDLQEVLGTHLAPQVVFVTVTQGQLVPGEG